MAWRRPGASHYLYQWWLVYWRIYASLGLNEVMTVTRYTCCTICLYHNTVTVRSIWWLLMAWTPLGLLTRYLYLRNSFEGRVPIDFIDRYPIFKWVSMTCLRWEGTETHVVAKVVAARARLNIKIILLAYGNFNYKDKTVVRPCYLYNGNPYIMGIPILVRRHLYIETTPRWHVSWHVLIDISHLWISTLSPFIIVSGNKGITAN